MKKILIILLIAVLLVGCGGSNQSPKGPRYTYQWTSGGLDAIGFTFATMTDEDPPLPPLPVYSGSVAPPFACVEYGTNKPVMGAVIYTYLDSVLVQSTYICDPGNGIMIVDTEHGVLRPIKTGIIPVFASYNEHALTIPVHVYWGYVFNGLLYVDLDTMTVYPDGSNPAVDVYFNNANFKARYGYQALPHDTVVSTVTSAPSGNYRILDFDQPYWAAYYSNVDKSIIKTSEGKYVKLCFLSQGSITTLCFWLSDTNGIFSH